MTFQEVLEQNHIPFAVAGSNKHARPGWLNISCPFCLNGAGKFHLGYSLNFHYCSCWHCGHHPAAKVLLELVPSIKPKAAWDLVKSWKAHSGAPDEVFVKTGVFTAPKGIKPMAGPHRAYLRSRGFDADEIAALWKVQGIGVHARLGWRLFIPIHYHGREVSWTTRSIANNSTQRYISASAEEESIPHKTLLYGEDYCRTSVVVVEGPTDAWAGGPGTVATMGTSFKIEQARRLSKYARVAVCFDNEADAQRRAVRLCEYLTSVATCEVSLVTLHSKDLGSADKKEILALRRKYLSVT